MLQVCREIGKEWELVKSSRKLCKDLLDNVYERTHLIMEVAWVPLSPASEEGLDFLKLIRDRDFAKAKAIKQISDEAGVTYLRRLFFSR